MKEEMIEAMIMDYLDGNLNEEELKKFQKLIDSGAIKVEEIEKLRMLLININAMPEAESSPLLAKKFNRMLASEIERAELAKYTWWGIGPQIRSLLSPLRLAYTLVLFGFGFFSAWVYFAPAQQKNDTEIIASELSDMKQILFATLIEQPEAVERLKAVNISQELYDVDGKVINALFNTLNQDPNVNVRLAAIDALKKHTQKPEVRKGLILSINKQESPIVQVALADLMQALQERNALPQLKQLLENENTNEFVKDKIKESINVLT